MRPLPPSKKLAISLGLIFIVLTILSANTLLSQTSPVRTVTIKLCLDVDLTRHQSSFRSQFFELTQESLDIFEQRFGLKFVINKHALFSAKHGSTIGLLRDLRTKIDKEGCDIVLMITTRNSDFSDNLGVSSYLDGYVLVRKVRPIGLMKTILKHEISHIFGAVHLKEKDSIMNVLRMGEDFDDLTSEIIRLNRNRSFIAGEYPLAGKSLDKAISLYTNQKKRYGYGPGFNFILASLYDEKGDYDDVIAECQEALRADPDTTVFHGLLAKAFYNTGRYSTP